LTHRRRIIFVDDELHLLVGLAKRFAESRADWDITYFQSASEALSHFASHGADAVVTDIIMPEMDGLELIAAIRQKNDSSRIIALSSDGKLRLSGATSAATVLGADRVLRKPVNFDVLIEALDDLL
jgi:DNA-binding response OmpR family regulator